MTNYTSPETVHGSRPRRGVVRKVGGIVLAASIALGTGTVVHAYDAHVLKAAQAQSSLVQAEANARGERAGEQRVASEVCKQLALAEDNDAINTAYFVRNTINTPQTHTSMSTKGGAIALTLSKTTKKPGGTAGEIFRTDYSTELDLVKNTDGSWKMLVGSGLNAETVERTGTAQYAGAMGVSITLNTRPQDASANKAAKDIQKAAATGDVSNLATAFVDALDPRDANENSLSSTFATDMVTQAASDGSSKYFFAPCSTDPKDRYSLLSYVANGQTALEIARMGLSNQ